MKQNLQYKIKCEITSIWQYIYIFLRADKMSSISTKDKYKRGG